MVIEGEACAVTEACVEYGIKYLSLLLSAKRIGKTESGILMNLMLDSIKKSDTFMKNGIKLLVLGSRERLSNG